MSRHLISAVLIFLLFGVFAASGQAQMLAKSGSINWHTGFQVSGDAITVAEGQMQGHGSAIGATFNDRGAGPLHLGSGECFYTFHIIDGSGTNSGYCAFGDADGDRIFTTFTGEVGLPSGYDEGTNVISGGTGKYAGITGSGPWKCKNVGAGGGIQCAQRLDYKLP